MSFSQLQTANSLESGFSASPGVLSRVENAIFGVFGVLGAKRQSHSAVVHTPLYVQAMFPALMIIDATQVLGLIIQSNTGWPAAIWAWSMSLFGLW
jgi:hypothetical protein